MQRPLFQTIFQHELVGTRVTRVTRDKSTHVTRKYKWILFYCLDKLDFIEKNIYTYETHDFLRCPAQCFLGQFPSRIVLKYNKNELDSKRVQ